MKKLFTCFASCFLAFGMSPAQTQVLADTSIENSGGGITAEWTSTSTNFGTAFCSIPLCGDCGGPCFPRSGDWYVYFGGVAGGYELSTLSQSFSLSSNSVGTLSFYYKIPFTGISADSMVIQVDGAEVWYKSGIDTLVGHDSEYVHEQIDLGALSSGSHNLTFFSSTNSDSTFYSMLVDDITLTVTSTAGTADYDFENGIVTFVNNLDHTLNFSFNFAQSTDLVIGLVDMGGRKLETKLLSGIRNDNITITTLGLSSGIYSVVFIKSNNSVLTKKIYIQN